VLAELGVTNAELSKNINRNKVSVSRWCTNDAQPSLEILYEIAEFLDVSIMELIIDNKKDQKK